jgi:Peptidase MA superfamily
MFWVRLICVAMGIMAVLLFPRSSPCADDIWFEDKSYHFIIQYSVKEDAAWAADVLRKAESYYDSIADAIGYPRHDQFWTWEQRVKIRVFSDQAMFVKFTGLPSWSRGAAVNHQSFLPKREIVTYQQDSGFLDRILPHEISHLIIRDFIGANKILPLWFDEGLAQLMEQGKEDIARRGMKQIVRQNNQIPFDIIAHYDTRAETDSRKVAIFYLQSVTMVDFLIKNFGSAKFAQFCRMLRDGANFDEAFERAYFQLLDSFKDYEDKWIKYLKNS